MIDAEQTARTLKTAWFAKAARKARITDEELCEAIQDVSMGQADDLGGGVFKKRLNKNMYRSIILAKFGRYWLYQYLSQRKIARTSTTMNSRRFACWLKIFKARPTQTLADSWQAAS